MRASGRSILLITRITGRCASSALRRTKRVCGSGPSDASTSSRIPSTIVSPRSTSPPKSACPGVSTMLSFTAPWRTAVFFARIVLPFSRSRSIESMTRSATSWFARKAPDCQSIASTSVVLPWSTWATIATLGGSSRRAGRSAIPRRLRGERRHAAGDEDDHEGEPPERDLGQPRAEGRPEPVAEQGARKPQQEGLGEDVLAQYAGEREDDEADPVGAHEVHRKVGLEAARRRLVTGEQQHGADPVERCGRAEETAEETRD